MFKKFSPYLLSIVIIQNFIISSISNFSPNSLYIKIISGLITFIIILTNYSIEVHQLIAGLKRNRIFFLSFILFIAYLTISLSWSTNPRFGFLKLIHFLVGNIPLFVSFCLVLINEEIQKGLIKSIIIVGLTSGIISLILNPFNPYLHYSFEITRWSHVVFGRFTGLAFLITILILERQSEKKRVILFTIVSLVIFISLFFSGFRSGIISVILSVLIYYFIVSFKEKDFRIILRVVFISGVIFTVSIIVSLLSNYNKNADRFKGILELISDGKTDDGTINSRFEAYLTGIKMFAEKPLFGQGFGGFNMNSYGSDIGTALKYPHNIFLEFLCELGLIGFGFLMVFIWVVLRRLIRIRSELLVIFIYGIVLAMFGKDMGSNGLVWIFLSCLVTNNLQVNAQKINLYRNRTQITRIERIFADSFRVV